MEKPKRLMLILVLFLFPTIACVSLGLTPQNAPTATGTVIFGEENQTPGIEPTGLLPSGVSVDSEGNCLKAGKGAINVGDPCILGSYAAHYDIDQIPTNYQTVKTSSLLQANLSLWAVSAGKLQGSAHLTYSLNSIYHDSESTTCATTTDIVKPFGWDVELDGQYFTQPDGSIQFLIQANPAHGPSYLEEISSVCPLSPRGPQNGVIWNGLGGRLIQGVYHKITDNPIPADSTGRFYTEMLVEVVK
jgi:hypothetical protein